MGDHYYGYDGEEDIQQEGLWGTLEVPLHKRNWRRFTPAGRMTVTKLVNLPPMAPTISAYGIDHIAPALFTQGQIWIDATNKVWAISALRSYHLESIIRWLDVGRIELVQRGIHIFNTTLWRALVTERDSRAVALQPKVKKEDVNEFLRKRITKHAALMKLITWGFSRSSFELSSAMEAEKYLNGLGYTLRSMSASEVHRYLQQSMER